MRMAPWQFKTTCSAPGCFTILPRDLWSYKEHLCERCRLKLEQGATTAASGFPLSHRRHTHTGPRL